MKYNIHDALRTWGGNILTLEDINYFGWISEPIWALIAT